LWLDIATTNYDEVPDQPASAHNIHISKDPRISKDRGNFELSLSNLAPGLPHVSMYNNHRAFASIYFVTKSDAEARQESRESWITNAPHSSAAVPNLSFGPVVERVILARQTGTNSFLNLNTGELLTPPPDVTNAIAAIQPTNLQVDNTERRWQGLDILENTQPFRYIAWLRESGADLMFNGNGQIIAFEGNFAIAHGASSADWDDWSGLSPEMTRAAVETIGSATRNVNSGTTTITLSTNSVGLTYTTAQKLFSRQGGVSADLLTREQSSTWFFRTREGSVGILQITGFTDNPHGVKLRYKLVEHGAPPRDDSSTLAYQQPVVVETFPISNARDVTPGEVEIRVRFSKPMTDGSWSWSSAWENSEPEFVGKPHYESDGRTCAVKVKVRPGRTYGFWLNSGKFQNFMDRDGRPSVPYLLIFQTKPN